MTEQVNFGGPWTQQKLETLSKYLRAYTTIFKKNPRASFYSITYLDAFAGTGTLRRPALGGLAALLPDLLRNEEEFRKGSVRRALEVDPGFDKYVFIEKSARKCKELRQIVANFPSKNTKVVHEDANTAILNWCAKLDPQRERAVAFLDPFGASVRWEVIANLGRTRAVDLWVLFPYSAINRMLSRRRKPPKSWSTRLTSAFGTSAWEDAFYRTTTLPSLLNSGIGVDVVHKSADYADITNFFVERLRGEFKAVSKPLPLYNSTGLLFILFFAAGNEKSATTGLKIANDIIDR